MTIPQKLILVTGATGYIASRLIPQLLDRGYTVRALARNPQRLRARSWSSQIDIVHGDMMEPASLAPALKDVHTAYYLVHNMSLGRGYTKLEIQAAQNFVLAAEEAGVGHIIYLGGLADDNQPISPHLLSRIETGAALSQGKIPVTEFRASIIAGSGSISFEMIRFTTEFFPIIPIPLWMKNRSQPIAIQNIMDYLLAALEKWDGSTVLEIGGPEIITYQEVMSRYARVRGHKRSFFLLPYVPVWFMALGIGLMTPVPRRIARALVRGLSHDSIVTHRNAHETYPEVNLMDFESATREAMTHLHPLKIERVWDDGEGYVKSLKHEGFFIDHRKIKISAEPKIIFNAITQLAAELEREKYAVDTTEPNHLLLLRSQRKTPGDLWLKWRLSRNDDSTYLTQTVFFAPRGLGGFAYWYLLYPFHILSNRAFLQRIVRKVFAP
ncbi:MAG: DUF2867 domain-containing protein [Chloroflexi bacterium]|nr:DUF2867 domain-containing protein [Chloroflexota bacterium]